VIAPGVPAPLPAAGDLRTELTRHLVARAVDRLHRRDRERERLLAAGRWRELGEEVRAHVRAAFGPMPFGAGAAVDARPVSRHETRHCGIENVLFESFPGWEVNASVFVPHGPGPFPAVVLPVGHSGKQHAEYQIPAQAFASLGFLAVLFDPPGQDSEKQPGNDHFADGVRTYLTGHSSNRYFVLDALRCIDYLATRSDVDSSHGVGMSGVSGGGHTTLFATLFDDRIACQGPSCCLNRMADHPVGDLYAPCPEGLWWNRIGAGMDEVDVLLAGMPTPTLLMAGRHDEVFHIEWSRGLATLCAGAFEAADRSERFAFFEDDAGHDYTLAQVRRFTAWMNRWLLGEPERPVPALDPADFPMLPYGHLRCHPGPVENMYTLNAALARRQAARLPERLDAAALADAVRAVTGTPGAPARWSEGEPFQLWSQDYYEALAVTADGLSMPASVLRPRPPARAGALVVFADDRGRHAALERNGLAARLSDMFERTPGAVLPEVVVADLPGWGESRPALAPFAAAGWGGMDRILSYLACAIGDGLLAVQTRALVELARAVAQERAGAPLALVGRGLGGAAALLAAALLRDPAATEPEAAPLSLVAALDFPARFLDLATDPGYRWPAAAFLPNALSHFDLPLVARSLAVHHLLLANPLDAQRRPLPDAEAHRAFGDLRPPFVLLPGSDRARAAPSLSDRLRHLAARHLSRDHVDHVST